jgi:protein-L-isoaspartate(D-aspartate) O-methyltransferase
MDLNQARFNMVEQQVRPWEVPDPSVLDAMMIVPRENFVPDEYQLLAFSDIRIPLGHGQSMFAPKWEGRLLQALAPQTHERALEIGTGSGYLAALLGRLCKEVISIDIHADFVSAATRRLRLASISNVTCISGDGIEGHPTEGPYDLIAVTASSPLRRVLIEQQLAPGGRLFMVVGTGPVMDAMLITRDLNDTFTASSLFELEVEPLIGAALQPRFEF